MKNKLNILVFLILSVVMYQCDDSFLEGQGTNMHHLQDTLFVMNDEVIEDLELNFPMAGNGTYTIVIFPGWMEFEALEGKFSDGKTFLSYTAKNIPATQQFGIYSGFIEMKIAGYGILILPVTYGNFGHPVISTNPSAIAVGDRQSLFFTIRNTSNGILFWQTGILPDWLELSEDKGIIGPNESVTLTVTVNRQDLELGMYSGSFTIFSNSAEKEMTVNVHMEVTKENSAVREEILAGVVTDAAYLKERDLLVICTKIPNRMLVYDYNNNSRHVIELDASPECIDFSPDGTKAMVGYNLGAISRIDMQTFIVEKTVEIDCLPHKVVYGENEWCYISPSKVQWTNLRNLNFETGELFHGNDLFYGNTVIKKQKNTNVIVGTHLGNSPNGIEVFKINSNYIISDSVGHFHVDTGNFWFSEDGKKMFCGNRRIYETPAYAHFYQDLLYGPSLKGILEPKLGRIDWIDHNQATNNIFVSESEFYRPTMIEVFDAGNYNLKREIPVKKIIFNSKEYDTVVQYLFSNSEGSLLFLVKGAYEDHYTFKLWSLEVIFDK
jgi:hypothetical protein